MIIFKICYQYIIDWFSGFISWETSEKEKMGYRKVFDFTFTETSTLSPKTEQNLDKRSIKMWQYQNFRALL